MYKPIEIKQICEEYHNLFDIYPKLLDAKNKTKTIHIEAWYIYDDNMQSYWVEVNYTYCKKNDHISSDHMELIPIEEFCDISNMKYGYGFMGSKQISVNVIYRKIKRRVSQLEKKISCRKE